MSKQAKLIDGKQLADQLLLQLVKSVSLLPRRPGLAAIMVGEDPASKLFIKRKKEAAIKVGISFHDYYCGQENYLPDITQEGVLELIDWLNLDEKIDAMIIQLPIPPRFDTEEIIKRMDPAKDVDGFHPDSYQALLAGRAPVMPPLIGAIDAAIQSTGQELTGMTAVVVAKRSVFSDPLAAHLQRSGMLAKLVPPSDPNLAEQTATADILISIVGQPGLIRRDMVKPEAIVIDVGTTLVGEKKFAGDVDPAVAKVAGWLTPVPGGIGPLTVACLLHNTYQLAKRDRA